MPRLSSALIAVALASTIPCYALAAGAYVRKEPIPIRASALPSLPSLPSVSRSESFNGCGGRRVRDPKTHECHGPGDIAR
jgi:hypothetical protein